MDRHKENNSFELLVLHNQGDEPSKQDCYCFEALATQNQKLFTHWQVPHWKLWINGGGWEGTRWSVDSIWRTMPCFWFPFSLVYSVESSRKEQETVSFWRFTLKLNGCYCDLWDSYIYWRFLLWLLYINSMILWCFALPCNIIYWLY